MVLFVNWKRNFFYLGYGKDEDLEKLHQDIGDVERMLKGLIKSLKNKHLTP